MVNEGVYKNLMTQYNRWHRRTNKKSYKTRERYNSSMSVFIQYLADEWRLQRLINIKPKHLSGFTSYRVDQGIATTTIVTDLSAIRFFLDLYENLRLPPKDFPTNEELRSSVKLAKRSFGNTVRAWSRREFDAMIDIIANPLGRPIVAQTLALAFLLGLRLHEVMQIDHWRIKQALDRDFIAIKGKGNKWRDVPLCDEARKVLLQAYQRTPRGELAFVEGNRPVHRQIKSTQKVISNHRAKLDSDRPVTRAEMLILSEVNAGPMEGPLTFHGLRHSYAMRQYHQFRTSGMSPLEARLKVSGLLGHERDDVTRIYLAGYVQGTIENEE